MRRRVPILFALSLASGLCVVAVSGVGCGDDDDSQPRSGGEVADENAPRVHGLTSAQAAQTLAKVGNTTITVGQFAQELADKGSFIRTRYSSPERRREFLDQMIRFELLAQEAERRNYDELPEVVRTRKQVMIRRFIEQRFDEGDAEDVSAESVRAYYEGHPEEFHTPEQVRASHIQVRDRATAERLLRQLQENESDLRLYRALSDEHNTDAETRDRFGDLRFFSRPADRTANEPDVPDAVREAAFSIEQIGALHPRVVRSDRGWHVVKLTGRRAAMHRTLEEAERPIRNRLWREQREVAIQRLIDELMAEADVQQNLELLSEVRIEVPEGELPDPQSEPVLPSDTPNRPTKRGTP